MNYISAKNKEFYYKGQPITLRGFGIGNWLCIEHFMIGLPGSEEVIRSAFLESFGKKIGEAFFKDYQENYITEKDFQFLKKCGVNFLRVPFNYRLFVDDQTEEWLEAGFKQFDRLFELCNKYEIFIMPDLHTTPGSQNPDWHSDNSFGVPLFWKYKVFRNKIVALWKMIAERYKDEQYLMGYDLLNEPAMADWTILNEFYADTIKAIRSVDSKHLIILEGDQFSMDFSGLQKFSDSNLALGFHYYPSVWHRDILEVERQEQIQQIADGLDRLIAFRDQFDCPVLCGEFGYGAPDLGGEGKANNLLKITLELFSERNLSWALWCYKDANYMSIISPKKNSLWMDFVNKIGKYWNQDIEKEHAKILIEQLKAQGFYLTKEEEYLLQFRLRADLYNLEKNQILIPELKKYSPVDLKRLTSQFSFENCQIDESLKNIITNFLSV